MEDDLTWRQTRPGRWERPQTHLEKMNILTRNVPQAIGRDNWAKNAVAKLEFGPTVKDPAAWLRIAWKQVRYNHPEIAAFPYGDKYIYRVGDEPSIALWISATFSVAEKMTVDQLLGRIPRNEQMMCYWLPETSEVMVWSPHYRVDARGAIYCLTHLIESLERMNPNLVFGGCAKNLTPSMEQTLDIHPKMTPDVERAVAKRFADMEPHKPLLELVPQISAPKPGYTNRHFVKLSKVDTTSIVAFCAASKLDLEVTLHAALIDAVTKVVPPSDARSFMASFHSNLRVLVPKGRAPIYSPTSYTSVITTEVDVSPRTDFNSYYRQLSPIYQSGYQPYLASSSFFHQQLGDKLFSKPSPKGETDQQLQPRFAFLGNVNEQVTKEVGKGLVSVKDFWLGAETLTMRIMVHTWIWDGQLVLSACFNQSYWNKKIVAELLDGMQETLVDMALPMMVHNVAL